MTILTADDIRERFLRFFEARDHLRVPSSSLIPAGDPTLLLTTAGMVQFKPYFTGESTPPRRRLTSCQKCFRTTDIDEVGDRKHLTFFEMLGNFSVGDYFKREAIAYAWEFVTRELGLPRERLWVTVYLDDDEAFGYWNRDVGVPAERIVRLGEKENFWGPAGSEGPCGPCSEIHYDFGEQYSCGRPTCGTPACPCDRFVELWNLVFMQFYQHPAGSRTPLPAPNIDTGMGLERAAAILQGKPSAYETDLFAPIVRKVEELSGKPYGNDAETDRAMRVVAEHARSATFLIADGVVPGNEGRGYVLRRVIRRAIRFGRRLGLEGPFFSRMAEAVIERMGPSYRELVSSREFILRAIELEEERFAETARRGESFIRGFVEETREIAADLIKVKTGLLNPRPVVVVGSLHFLSPVAVVTRGGHPSALPGRDEESGALLARELLVDRLTLDEFQATRTAPLPRQIAEISLRLTRTGDKLSRAKQKLPGEFVFLLYDTYGFPPELTREIAREHGLDVDMEGFQKEMEAQRQRARAAAHFGGGPSAEGRAYQELGVGATAFLGYEALEAESVVVGLLRGGHPVGAVQPGDEAEVVLRETPFYAEGGGQVGDTGVLEGLTGRFLVQDTQKPVGDIIVHRGRVEEGSLSLGDTVRAKVDAPRRQDIARNHTATHLLHAALRQVLGTHVRQAGSLVTPDRLRFDFTHVGAVSRDELLQVQRLVNAKIRQNVPVTKTETTYRSAVEMGALAFFGERYGHEVRVVEVDAVPPYSLEVCGGTHVERTGDIGYVHVLSESSIGSGMRRIEAVTGRRAEELLWERMAALDSLARTLQTTPAELEPRAAALLEELEQARKQAAQAQRDTSRREAEELLSRVQQVDGVKVLSARTSAASVEGLREVGDWLRDKLGSGIVVVGGVFNDKPTLVAMVTRDLVARGYHAGNIVSEVARAMGGGGGGRPDVAQAGGRDKEKLDAALARVVEVVRRALDPKGRAGGKR